MVAIRSKGEVVAMEGEKARHRQRVNGMLISDWVTKKFRPWQTHRPTNPKGGNSINTILGSVVVGTPKA